MTDDVLLQVLDRGEKIELLVDKTENLRSQVRTSCHFVLPCNAAKRAMPSDTNWNLFVPD